MTQRRANETLCRQWQLIETLGGSECGRTVQELTSVLEVSRSTLYRDLAGLRASGVELDTVTVSGKVRLKLPQPRPCQVSPSPLQIAALRLARRSLSALEGTAGVLELDALLAQWTRHTDLPTEQPLPVEHVPRRDSVLQAALQRGDDVRIVYHEGGGRTVHRSRVTPLGWIDREGHAYLLVADADGSRTFCVGSSELVRVEPLVQTTRRPSDGPPASTEVRTGVVQPLWVEVRLAARAARRLARLPRLGEHQTLHRDAESAVVVRARARSLIEARRWVLSLGADAEALAPDELRSDLAEEAHRMDTLYWRRPFRVAKVSEPTDAYQLVAEAPNLAAR